MKSGYELKIRHSWFHALQEHLIQALQTRNRGECAFIHHPWCDCFVPPRNPDCRPIPDNISSDCNLTPSPTWSIVKWPPTSGSFLLLRSDEAPSWPAIPLRLSKSQPAIEDATRKRSPLATVTKFPSKNDSTIPGRPISCYLRSWLLAFHAACRC